MKKRFMLVAVLLGSLALTSCVDDKESDSVTALRNAVVEKIKANAALTNASADLRRADAMYRQAEAEIKANDAELDEATMAQKLEKAKVDADAALLVAQAAYEQEKANLVEALDKEAAAEAQRVKDLVTEADKAYKELVDARTDKLEAEANLLKLQYGLESAQALAANTINAEKQKIAAQEALIAEYEKYASADKEEALAAAQEAEAQKTVMNAIKTQKAALLGAATAEMTAANNNVAGSEFRQCATTTGSSYVTMNTTPLFEGVTAGSYTVDVKFDDGQVSTYTVGITASTYTVKTDALAQAVATAQKGVDVATLELAEANKKLADKKAEAGYKAAEKAVADAQKAYDEATTAADKTAKWPAVTSAQATLAAYATTEENDVVTKETALASAKTALDNITKISDSLTGDAAKEYDTLIANYIEAVKAVSAAGVEEAKANHNYTVQSNLAIALNGVAVGTTDVEAEINKCKDKIAASNKTIAEQSDILLMNGAQSYQVQIDAQEKIIAKAENDIAVYEAIYNAYVEKINAILAGEE